jgi:hypothetical protein
MFFTTQALAQTKTQPDAKRGSLADVRAVGDAMDALARQAEEWGTMQMSAPLLVEPGTNYNFNLQRGASNYFNEAKSEIQAATAALNQQSQSLSLALQAQNNSALTNAPAANTSSNLPNSSNVAGSTTNSQGVFNAAQFTQFLGLLNSLNAPSPALNNSAALNIAAGDQATEAIFRLLGDPEKAAQYAGRKVMFGVVTVSVNPGFRTRKDYAADLGVVPRFEYLDARLAVVKRLAQDTNLTDHVRAAVLVSYHLESDTNFIGKIKWLGKNPPDFEEIKTEQLTASNQGAKLNILKIETGTAKEDSGALRARAQEYESMELEHEKLITKLSREVPQELQTNSSSVPLCTPISPLASMDVTDEASSLRNQNSFALSLAGLLQKAGLQAQASAFEQYAKRSEQDAHSRTALAVVNTYSAGGGLFGWQVGPRFRAMDDPGVKKSGAPANVLDRQTFPSLLLIALNQEDFYPHLRINDDGRVTVLEPYLAFRTVSRWLPLKHGWWGRLWQKRFSETELLETSANLVHVRNLLTNLVTNSVYSRTADLAEYRLRALGFDNFGNDNGQNFDPQQVVPLPAEPVAEPAIAGVFPTEIRLEPDAQGNPQPLEQTFAIVGQNFKGVDTTYITNLAGQVQSLSFCKPANVVTAALTNLTNNVLFVQGIITTNEPIMFGLQSKPLTNSAGTVTTNYLCTPKVTVSFRNDTNAPVAVVKTVQNFANTTNNTTEFTVKIAPKNNPEDVKTALSIIVNEINKAKPSDNANVSVQVQADQKK